MTAMLLQACSGIVGTVPADMAKTRRMLIRGAGLAAGCILLAGCGRDRDDELLGTLERDRIELVAEVSEPIVVIDVREGDRVSTGQVVLRQDRRAVDARLAAARATETQARHRLDELAAGPRREEILEAGAALDAARAQALAAEQEFARVGALVAKQLLAAAELDRQRAVRDAGAAPISRDCPSRAARG